VAERRWRSANKFSLEHYDTTPAIMAFCAGGFGAVIAVYEGTYTLVHRGRAGLKTYFAEPQEEDEATPRVSQDAVKDEEVRLEQV
jgi:hypothetical protein